MGKALDLLNKVRLNSVKANLNKPKIPTVTTPSENKYVKSVLSDMQSKNKKSVNYSDPITRAKNIAQKMSETAAEENRAGNAYYARTINDPENMTSDDLRTLKENLRIQLNREQRKDSSKQDADKIAQIKGYITAIDSTKLDGGTVSINEMNSTARAAYNKTVSPDTTDYGQGNINLKDRPIILNADGSYSTVRSMSFNDKGKEILIPTVIRDENGNGKIVSDDEAIQHYYDTGEYLGKFNSTAEADEYAEKLHKNQQKLYEKKAFAQSVYAKYGINTDKFSYTDLAKWKSDNVGEGVVKSEINKNNALRKFLLSEIGSKLNADYDVLHGITGVKGKTEVNSELTKEYDVLSALAENNNRTQNFDNGKSNNQFIPEPLSTGMNSAAKGLTFGLSDYLTDKTDKLRFNRTGLDDDKYVSVKDINQKQSEEHPIASFAGDMIGSTAATIGLGNVIKGISSTLKFGKGIAAATSKIPWFAKLAPQTQNVINTAISSAVETGVTFGTSNAVQTGTNGGSAKDVAKAGGIGFASGAAGSTFSSAASSVLGKAAEKYSTNALVKKLYQNMNVEGTELSVNAAGRVDNYINALYKNYNLKDYWLPQQLVKAASAVTFAAVSTGTSVGLNAATTDGYNPTAEETAKEIAKQATVALIFSLWNSTTEYSKLSKANKNLIMNSAKEMANEVYDLDEMYRSGKADTPEFEAKKNSFMKNADTMEKIFSTVDFVGNKEQQQQLVNGIRFLRDNVNSALKTETANTSTVDAEFSPKSAAKTDYTNTLNTNLELYGKTAPEQAARAINKATEVISNTLASTVKGTNTQVIHDINVKFLSNPNNIIDRSFVSDYSNLFVGLMAAGNGQAYRAIIQKTNNLPEVLTEYTINGYAEPEIKNTAGFNTVASTFNGVVQKAAEVNYSLRNKIYDNNPVLDMQINAIKNGDFSVVDSVSDENVPTEANNQTAPAPQEAENDVKPVSSTQNPDAMLPEKAQTYNRLVSNLKRKGEELGLLDRDFFIRLQEVENFYNPSTSDRALISSEFHRVFAGNTDPLVISWLDGLDSVAGISTATNANTENIYVISEKSPVNKDVASTQNNTSAMDKNLNIENIVEKNIYPEFRENSAEMFAKQYGGTRFSGFAQQLIKNFRETGSIGETEKNFFADNGAAVTEAIRNAIKSENSNVENISERTFDSVGNRRVKAFQYSYPQMKKYYSEMANVLLGDIKATVKGERTPIFDESRAVTGYTGTERHTSEAIARIKDTTGASYGEIADALNRIITDSGQENIALAKRIELVMDDMLTEGYTAVDGTKVPANEDYIAEKALIENKSGKSEVKQQIINDYAQAVDDIMTVDDETAKALNQNGTFVSVLEKTPDIILNNVENSNDLPIIMMYNKLYMAVRRNGVFKGHYHNLGADVVKQLPNYLASPDVIIQLPNGRINILTSVETERGNNGIISVELNTYKKTNGKYNQYNMVITMFSSDDKYVKNLLSGEGVTIKYIKKDLLQGSSQLYKWLSAVNNKSFIDNSIPQDNNIVNNKDMQETENNSDNDDLSKSTERAQSRKMSPELYDRFRQLQEEADKLSASASNTKSVYSAAELESRIKEQLANGVNTVDEITRKIGAKVNDIHVALFNMAVNGDVKQKPGNRYELISDTTASDKTTKIGADSDAAANKNTTDVNKSASNVEDDNGDNNIQKTESNAVTEEKSPENVLKSLSMGESVSVEEVKAAANAICDNEAEIKAGLSKLKNAELKSKMNIFDRGSYSKKDDMVEAIYSDMLSNTYYTISGKNSITTFMNGTSMNEQIKGLIKTELKSLNAERLKTLSEKYSEEHKKHIAEREKIKNSLKNPQTLEDYSRKKRTIGLSEQENADFEKLYALTRKENRNASKSSVKSSKTEAANNFLKNNDNFAIEETKHSKTGENIWVVKPKERLATEEWKNINNSMKSLGGFYWKGNGGWNFKKNPIAEKVSEETSVQGSNVDKLRDIADNMQKSIDERFRERLTNTAKRASQAASAEAEGEKLQRTQNTIRNIADGIEDGNIKLLTDIDSKAQVDTLFRLLNLAQNDRINNIEDITYSERLKERDKPYGNEDIKYAKLPLDTVYSGIIEEYAKAAEGKDGYKMIHSRLSKALKGAKNNYISVTPQLFADISKVVKNLDVLRADYWEDGTAQLNRLKRMGIENNAELRAYLREFVENIPGIDKEAEHKRAIKKKEVELTNSKIDGFFPTPKSIVEKMLYEANIKKGETVLEPSAGKGNIADEIRAQYPENSLEVAEINSGLSDLLKDKGYKVVGDDFLKTDKKYDKIIMNPPFEKLQDIDHVMHAYDMLNPGGRLVSIMSESPFFNSAKKAENFRNWLEEVGGVSEKLPENSFKGSERSTGVNTRLVVVDKLSAPLPGKSNSNVKYSLNNNSGNDAEWWSGNTENITAKFAKQIDNWQHGKMKSNEHFDLGHTPSVLQKIGADNLPVIMTQKVMEKITGGKHDIDLTEIKKLPQNLANPIMVFQSATIPNAYVILTEMNDRNGNSVVTAMHLNKKDGFNFVNRIASVYGKEKIGNFIRNQSEAGNLIYIDKNKSQKWSQSRGIQLPKPIDTIADNKKQEQLHSRGLQSPKLNTALDNNNISHKSDIVNSKHMQKNEKYSSDSSTVSEANSNRKQKKAPIKAPHDIVKYLSDTFGIPISTGNIGNRKASGIYKMPAQTIRTKITNDLPIIAHELGHMFDDKYNLSDAEHINDVLNFAHKLDAEFLEQYSGDEQDGEAIAQFVRTYLSNPEKAKQGAPKFYKEFTEKLSNEDLNALNQAAEYINQYLSADFMDRLHSNIVTNKELKERTSAKEKMKKFYITIVDAFAPIKDAADYVEKAEGKQSGNKNAYTLAMNSKNADAVIAFILREGMVDKDGNIVGKSLVECLSDIPATQLQLFADYLLLKHSPDWLAPKDGSAPKRVFSDEELQNVENINRQIEVLEKNYPHFMQAANNLYEYERNLLKYWCVDIGGMSEELFNRLWKRYPHYVPLYRAINKNIGTKRSFANQRTPINRAHGSGEAIKNVIESIIYNTEKFVKFGMRNRVMQILSDYADNVEGFGSFMEPVAPNMIAHTIGITDKIEQVKEMLSGLKDNDFTALTEALDNVFGDSVTSYTPVAVAGKQIVTVMRNGKFKYYQVHNKELFDAISNISPQQLGWFVKFSRKVLMPTNLLITQFNPRFAIWNPMRDIDTAYKQTQAYDSMASFITGYVRAFYHRLSKSDEYKAYLAAGGGHMSKFSGNIDQVEKALRELSHKDMGKARRLAYAIFRHPVEMLVSLNEFTETIPRLAEFEGMKKKGSDTQEAINAAADVTTNFSRSGTAGEGLNGGFRFSNAQIQGVDKFRRTFMESSRELLKRVIIRYLLSALFTTALLEAWNRKSKESREAWDNLSKYTKNNYYCIYIGDGKFLKLAKAREAAIFNTLLERTVDKCFGDKYAFYQFGEYLSDTIIPSFVPTKALVGDTKGALHQMLGETAIGGFADNLANMDFKGTPIVSKSFEDIPKKQQTDERTTYIAYGLGQILNQSPLEIDHLIDSYGGILGQVNRSIGAMSGKNKKSGLTSSFIADSTYSTDVFNYMYERRDKYKEKFLNKPTPESAAMYEKYAMGASMITKSNKLIKEMPEDEQKAAKQKLLDTVKDYREESKQTDKQIAQSLGSDLSKEYLITSMPEPQLSRKNKLSGKNEKSDLTFDEYNQYLKDYLSALNTERQKQLKSETYKAATTDEKVKFLKDANERAKETAKNKYFSSKQKN